MGHVRTTSRTWSRRTRRELLPRERVLTGDHCPGGTPGSPTESGPASAGPGSSPGQAWCPGRSRNNVSISVHETPGHTRVAPGTAQRDIARAAAVCADIVTPWSIDLSVGGLACGVWTEIFNAESKGFEFPQRHDLSVRSTEGARVPNSKGEAVLTDSDTDPKDVDAAAKADETAAGAGS